MATCGEKLIAILESYGVELVFGIPGVHTIELYRGLKRSNIRHITPRHEQGAGFMADGYARSTGGVGVCFIITGPGMTNIATAMAQALQDSIPMLVISTVSRSDQLGLGEGRLHELPHQRNLVAEVSVFSHTLFRAEELPKVLARAFGVFASQRPGPVHIEIPLDVISSPADSIDTSAWPLPSAPAAAPEAIERAAALLREARRPLIAIGGGAIRAGEEVTRLAEILGAPVVNTVNAKGVVPSSHPLAVGGSGSCAAVRDAFREADVVLGAGTEFSETDYDVYFNGDLSFRWEADPPRHRRRAAQPQPQAPSGDLQRRPPRADRTDFRTGARPAQLERRCSPGAGDPRRLCNAGKMSGIRHSSTPFATRFRKRSSRAIRRNRPITRVCITKPKRRGATSTP